MGLTKEQIQHVADLARLKLTAAEISKFGKELTGILDYVNILNEVNTEGVEPTAQVTGLVNVTEKDEISAFGNPEKLLHCSPMPVSGAQIKVKSVF